MQEQLVIKKNQWIILILLISESKRRNDLKNTGNTFCPIVCLFLYFDKLYHRFNLTDDLKINSNPVFYYKMYN